MFCTHNNKSLICLPVFKLAAIHIHPNHYYDSFDKTRLFSALLSSIYFCIPRNTSLQKCSKGFEDCPQFSLLRYFRM